MPDQQYSITVLFRVNASGATAGINKMKSDFSSLQLSLGKVARLVGVAGIGYELKQTIMTAHTFAKDFEAMGIRLGVILGSSEAGTRLAWQIDNLVKVLPILTGEAVRAARIMLAFGVSADNVAGSLEMLSKAALISGYDVDQITMHVARLASPSTFGRSAYALAMMGFKIRDWGKFANHEIKNSTEAVTEFANYVNTKYTGALSAWLLTTESKLRAFRANYMRMLREMGFKINDALKPILDVLIKFSIQNKAFAADIGKEIASMMGGFQQFLSLATGAITFIGNLNHSWMEWNKNLFYSTKELDQLQLQFGGLTIAQREHLEEIIKLKKEMAEIQSKGFSLARVLNPLRALADVGDAFKQMQLANKMWAETAQMQIEAGKTDWLTKTALAAKNTYEWLKKGYDFKKVQEQNNRILQQEAIKAQLIEEQRVKCLAYVNALGGAVSQNEMIAVLVSEAISLEEKKKSVLSYISMQMGHIVDGEHALEMATSATNDQMWNVYNILQKQNVEVQSLIDKIPAAYGGIADKFQEFTDNIDKNQKAWNDWLADADVANDKLQDSVSGFATDLDMLADGVEVVRAKWELAQKQVDAYGKTAIDNKAFLNNLEKEADKISDKHGIDLANESAWLDLIIDVKKKIKDETDEGTGSVKQQGEEWKKILDALRESFEINDLNHDIYGQTLISAQDRLDIVKQELSAYMDQVDVLRVIDDLNKKAKEEAVLTALDPFAVKRATGPGDIEGGARGMEKTLAMTESISRGWQNVNSQIMLLPYSVSKTNDGIEVMLKEANDLKETTKDINDEFKKVGEALGKVGAGRGGGLEGKGFELSPNFEKFKQAGAILTEGMNPRTIGKIIGLFAGKLISNFLAKTLGDVLGGLAAGFLSFIIPGLQEGGYVTRPTLALIGEGRHHEAVLPMPHLYSLVDKVLNSKATIAGGGAPQGETVVIHIHNSGSLIDTQRVQEDIYNAYQRAKKAVDRRGMVVG